MKNLLGRTPLSAIPDVELVNGLLGLGDIQSAQVVAKKIRQGSGAELKTLTGKALFEKRISEINDDKVRQMLINGELTAIPAALYHIIACGSDTKFKFFDSGVAKAQWTTNVANGKLGSTEAFLLVAIQLLVGECATSGAATYKVPFQTAMGTASTPHYLYNGEITMKNDQKVILDQMSTSVFEHSRTDIPPKTFVLDSPKILQPGSLIPVNVEVGAAIAAQSSYSSYVKLVLIGLITAKA